MPPLNESAYCWSHDPALAAERAAARKRGGTASHSRLTDSLPSQPAVQLRNVTALQSVLEHVVNDELARSPSAQRTRTVVYALTLALKTLEVGEFEQRLTALEQRLGKKEKSETKS
jgi:hypothetical protein